MRSNNRISVTKQWNNATVLCLTLCAILFYRCCHSCKVSMYVSSLKAYAILFDQLLHSPTVLWTSLGMSLDLRCSRWIIAVAGGGGYCTSHSAQRQNFWKALKKLSKLPMTTFFANLEQSLFCDKVLITAYLYSCVLQFLSQLKFNILHCAMFTFLSNLPRYISLCVCCCTVLLWCAISCVVVC